MPYLVLALGLVLGGWLFFHWFLQAPPQSLVKGVSIAFAVIGGVMAFYLIVSGRLPLALMALVFLLPEFMRRMSQSGVWRTASGPAPGQASEISTAYLRMRLDHDTGRMSGEVIAGRWRGRRVEELEPEQLLDLLGECQAHDPDSAQVLESYLDRTFPDWRSTGPTGEDDGEPRAPPGRKRMSVEEARQVLGLEPGANTAEIKAAHRRLMRQAHPDHGGSDYLAAKINEAKAVLLDEP